MNRLCPTCGTHGLPARERRKGLARLRPRLTERCRTCGASFAAWRPRPLATWKRRCPTCKARGLSLARLERVFWTLCAGVPCEACGAHATVPAVFRMLYWVVAFIPVTALAAVMLTAPYPGVLPMAAPILFFVPGYLAVVFELAVLPIVAVIKRVCPSCNGPGVLPERLQWLLWTPRRHVPCDGCGAPITIAPWVRALFWLALLAPLAALNLSGFYHAYGWIVLLVGPVVFAAVFPLLVLPLVPIRAGKGAAADSSSAP